MKFVVPFAALAAVGAYAHAGGGQTPAFVLLAAIAFYLAVNFALMRD